MTATRSFTTVLLVLVIVLASGTALLLAERREQARQLNEALRMQGQALDAAESARQEEKKYVERIAQLSELERFKEPQPPAIPRIVESPILAENLRAEVIDVAGDLATISIGIDAGLRVGTVLEVYRSDGKKVIGTVKVTDAFNLYAKQAVVKFIPARKAPLNELSPDELPKKGDVVRPMKKKD
jgi:hypothetical protein